MINRVIYVFFNVLVLCEAGTEVTRTYLVFGGNGLLGGEIVSLLRLRPVSDITIVNRGNWYWDSKFRIKPFVRHVKCDRYRIKECKPLAKLIEEKKYFNMVYDFSSYRADHLKDVLEVLRNRVGRYVYISSDSTYEVCKPSPHGGPSREEDAVWYEDYTELKKQEGFDFYGYAKLECEEVLEQEHKDHKLTYISLRLPDVIGPRDNTDRFWIYFLWVKFQDILDRPLYFPPRLHNQKLSMVHAEDVAFMMLSLNDFPNDVFNQAYNLAFRETVTLKEFLTILGKHVGNTDLVFDESRFDGPVYFPSVKRGPLNITKAERKLNWRPVSVWDGIKKTAQFYNYAMKATEFRQQRDGTVEMFIPHTKMEKFKQKFKEIYGSEFSLKYQLPAHTDL